MSVAFDQTRAQPAGGAATQISVGEILDLEPNAEANGSNWYGDGVSFGRSQQMMRDPHVRMSVDARVAPIVSALWDTEPASDDPLDVEAADYLAWVFFEKNDFLSLLRTGTTGYTRDGFAIHEFTDDVCDIPSARFPLHPGAGRGIAYTGFHHRPAWSIESWYQSKKNPAQIDGVKQRLFGSDVEPIGSKDIRFSDGALLFRMTWDQEGANFAGLAALRSAWGAFKKKRLLEIIEMIRHEREGAPIPELKEPDTNGQATGDEKAVGKEILRGLRSHEQSYLQLPPGWEFRWVPGGGQATGLREAQEACNRDIAYNLHVAWMLLGSAGKTGSFALATEQKGQYIMSAEQQARFWEFALNVGQDGWSPVERCIRLNYGPKVGMPRIVARNMPLKDWTQWLSLLPQLIQADILRADDSLESFVRAIVTLPQADPKTRRARPAPVVELGAGPTKKAEPATDVDDDARDDDAGDEDTKKEAA